MHIASAMLQSSLLQEQFLGTPFLGTPMTRQITLHTFAKTPVKHPVKHTATLLLLSSLLLPVASVADRPAMEAQQAPTNADRAEVQTATNSPQPAPALSSVELMMQRQTGTVLQDLPAKEMQPGETISIQTLDNPRRGATMDKVQNELGAPLSSSAPIGTPPITTWVYDDRIVYFEYSHVIHVVTR